ncbi:MAG: NAD-binding protein [Desulfuromonadales bacterium]|nr:NAD-binding protein [Desulfuromonadales bacterium]
MRVILVGSGRILYYLARQFIRKEYDVQIIAPTLLEARELSQHVSRPVLAGDATDPKILEGVGAFRADVVLALTPNDEDNLAVCQIAGLMYKVPRTIALVNDPENEEVFHKLNVSVAISATRILSIILEEQAGFEEIGKLISVAEGRVSVAEITLREDSPAAGATIDSLVLPDEALIGGIIREGKVQIPKGGSRLLTADRLILIATDTSMDEAIRELVGENGN